MSASKVFLLLAILFSWSASSSMVDLCKSLPASTEVEVICHHDSTVWTGAEFIERKTKEYYLGHTSRSVLIRAEHTKGVSQLLEDPRLRIEDRTAKFPLVFAQVVESSEYSVKTTCQEVLTFIDGPNLCSYYHLVRRFGGDLLYNMGIKNEFRRWGLKISAEEIKAQQGLAIGEEIKTGEEIKMNQGAASWDEAWDRFVGKCSFGIRGSIKLGCRKTYQDWGNVGDSYLELPNERIFGVDSYSFRGEETVEVNSKGEFLMEPTIIWGSSFGSNTTTHYDEVWVSCKHLRTTRSKDLLCKKLGSFPKIYSGRGLSGKGETKYTPAWRYSKERLSEIGIEYTEVTH